MEKFKVVVAGSTKNTQILVKGLINSCFFDIQLAITPEAKLVGRRQILTPSVMEVWAKEQNIPVKTVQGRKIDKKMLTEEMANMSRPDFLLVTDFGYLLPEWLLKWAKIAPINVHPSALPNWRGSSPGQMVILSGVAESAVSIMIPDQKMDQGPIVKQIPLKIIHNWTQHDYYEASFAIAAEKLPKILLDLAMKKIDPREQPLLSPTPTARQLKKQDGFIPFEIIEKALNSAELKKDELIEISQKYPDAPLLSLTETMMKMNNNNFVLANNWTEWLDRASKALAGWPGIWTIMPTKTKKQYANIASKRIKILSVILSENQTEIIEIKVIIEGKSKPQFIDKAWIE